MVIAIRFTRTGEGTAMRPGIWIGLLLVLSAATMGSIAAHADGRVALVIGNSAYQHLPVLDSPRNDATAVAAKLERLGYTVITGLDLDRIATAAIVQQFGQAITKADIALFYYAGHGLEVSNRDYLVPIDAALTDARVLDRTAFDLEDVLAVMEKGPDVGLVFFDASRDNPLPPDVEPPAGDSVGRAEFPPRGLVIAHATAPGRAALHGRGDAHSPFTAALLQYMDMPGLRVQDLLSKVRSAVMNATAAREIPWDTAVMLGRDVFLAGP
jgi:uncharacterized caspase-like protein